MNTNKAIEILKKVKNGTFGVVEYETEVPVNKAGKAAGMQIFCRTKKLVRFGAAYKNLVKDSTDVVRPRTNNYQWLLDNKVSHNSNTEKDYLRVSTVDRKTLKRIYRCVTPLGTKLVEDLGDYVEFLRPSTMVPLYNRPLVQNITMSNVISINGMGD